MAEPESAPETAMSSAAVGAERRTAPRYAGNRALLCDVLGELPGECWTARIHDVSRNGIALLLSGRQRRGTILKVQFRPPTAGVVGPRHACVIHSSRQMQGLFIVGCALDCELSPDELQALL
jgi:hypothetical protein